MPAAACIKHTPNRYMLCVTACCMYVCNYGCHKENVARLSVCLELDNRPIVSAMGALLHFLRSDIFTLDSGHVTVADMQPLVVDEYLRIDSATFKSLQIFCEGSYACMSVICCDMRESFPQQFCCCMHTTCEDQHPLLFKEKGRSKEGFSLFSLLDRTVSLPGT